LNAKLLGLDPEVDDDLDLYGTAILCPERVETSGEVLIGPGIDLSGDSDSGKWTKRLELTLCALMAHL
jgi:hypothetical protein